MSTITSSKPIPLWRIVFFYSAISALLLAGEKAIDSIVSNRYLDNVDQFTSASSYILVGGWFGVGVSILLAFVFGNLLHKVGNINLNRRKMYKPTIKAGLAGAGFTFAFLFGLQFLDLQLMYAFTAPYLLFVVFKEWRQGKISQVQTFLLPAIIIVVGSMLSAYDPAWFSSSTDTGTFIALAAVVFVSYNYLFATDELLQKEAVDAADPMNVQLLRAIVLAISASISVIAIAFLRGEEVALANASLHLINNAEARAMLLLLFVFVTFGLVAKLMAKSASENVSQVVLVIAGHLAIGVPLSFLLNRLLPGAAGDLPTSEETISVRLIGAVVLGVGIWVLLRKYQRKA